MNACECSGGQCGHGARDRRPYRFMAGVPGEPGARGERGLRGERGAVFIPSVDAAGNLSWQNDGGLPNPAAQNIRGPQGEAGEPSAFFADYGVTTLAQLDAAYEAGRSLFVRGSSSGSLVYTFIGTFRFPLPDGTIRNGYKFGCVRDKISYECEHGMNGWSRKSEDLECPITKASISLGAVWNGSGPYTQTVTVPGVTVTPDSKVDLQPDMSALESLAGRGVTALYIENNNGTLTAWAAGAAPPAMTIQCTVTEVRAWA